MTFTSRTFRTLYCEGEGTANTALSGKYNAATISGGMGNGSIGTVCNVCTVCGTTLLYSAAAYAERICTGLCGTVASRT